MASSLQVLCPNGRRQKVQINPNTKLLQILEEVCQYQGFVPPEDYKLVQGQARKELDLSLAVRFSSLPNNAKLEMVKCASKRVEQDVTIAVQLDSGQRLQDSFKPSTNLWNILLHMENKNKEYKDRLTRVDTSQTPALHPVCIFMREEVIGESALTATTLKTLGLTSGKAIIRLLHQPVEDRVLSDIEAKIEKDKQKQARLEEIALRKSELRILDDMESKRKAGDVILDDVKEETSEGSAMETCEYQDSPQFVETDLRSGLDSSESMQELLDESSPTTPVPSDSSSRAKLPNTSAKKVPAQESADRSQQGSAIEDLRNLNLPGVEIFTPDDFHDLTPQAQIAAQRLLQKYVSGLQPGSTGLSTQSSLPALQQSDEPDMSFADFKFPEETRGMDLTGGTGNRSLESLLQCDRECLIYNTEEPLPCAPSNNTNVVPDDFFEVTQADVKIMYRDLQNAVRQMEDQPLITKTLRQAQEEAMYDKYERVVIRVQFPERLTLQGLFRPREPVSALYAFVREYLRDPSEEFYLYTSPPKKVIKDKQSSLAACHLAPAALVYCGSQTHRDVLLSDKVKVKARISHRLKAEAQVARVLHSVLDAGSVSSAESRTEDGRASTSQADAPRAPRRIEYGSSTSSDATLPSGSQVPKWLRLSKK